MQTNLNTRTKQTHGPTARQTIGPATLGRNSTPLEGYSAAPVQIRLARGSVALSSEVPSRSRVGRPPSGTSPCSGVGRPPRAGPRLDRGPNAPSSEFPPRSRALRAAAPVPAPPAGAFNALTPAGVQVKGESTPLRAWESCPATAPPTPMARPSPPLCDAVRCGQQPPRGTVPPTPVRRTAPSKKDGGTLEGMTHNYSAPARDGAVTSGQWERSPPSPSALCDHPRHRDAIPPLRHHTRRCGTCGDRTPPRQPLCLVRPPVDGTLELARGQRPDEHPLRHHPRSRSCTGTELATASQ
jgi:hypothetical protein